MTRSKESATRRSNTAARLTDNGKGIDDHQVHAERLAYLATQVEAARSCLHYAQAAGANRADENGHTASMALGFAAEVGQRLVGQVGTHIEDFGFDEAFLNDTLGQPQVRAAIRDGARESRFREIGQTVLATKGVNHSWLESDIAAMTRIRCVSLPRARSRPLRSASTATTS